ncbi:hypothetical protein OEA_28715 (plasmid) [Priestia megaterium NCT-2]|nr:hypothetical protein OEA_28715 [Priestia megaterium NCT-2]
MTGNLSRTVLRGAGARESACLPDLTGYVYDIQRKNRKNTVFALRIVILYCRAYFFRLGDTSTSQFFYYEYNILFYI